MKSDHVQNFGSAVIVFGIVMGLMLGFVAKFISGGFGFGVMFFCWISGVVLGVLFIVLGSVLNELETIRAVLLLSPEEKQELISKRAEKGWNCESCGAANSEFSSACRACGEKRQISA